MDELRRKIEALRENGYAHDWSRDIYYSREAKKVFSREALEDHDLYWLESHLQEQPSSQWSFYFNSQPSESVRNNLTQMLS